jgi:hypothetical protein
MSIGFLSPAGALVVLVVAVPLGAFWLLERRIRRVTRALAVEPAPLRSRLGVPVAIAAAVALLALAAAEPVVGVTHTRRTAVRAEVVFVIDTSRSMGAAPAPGAPSRLDRAKEIAAVLRAHVPDVPAGISSFTDRVLPHLFPSPDPRVFAATLADAIKIDSPPPNHGETGGRSTDLTALAAVPRTGFFLPGATKRLVIVLTDAESLPASRAVVGAAYQRPPGARAIFVHVWNARDRIWIGSHTDPGYRPDPSSAGTAERMALATGGRSFAESDVAGAVSAARAAVAGAGTSNENVSETSRPVGVWLALAAALPLALVLRARNLRCPGRGGLARA